MQARRNFLRVPGKGLLASTLLATLCVTGTAFAQDDEEQDELSEIIVTGSRVTTGEAPVGATATILGRDDIDQSAATTVDRLVKELPQVFNLGVTDSSRSQNPVDTRCSGAR